MQQIIATIIALILITFPFLGIFSVWKDWLAFALGLIYVVVIIAKRMRQPQKENTDKEYGDKS